jgi:uroporphyrinogen III methyltransferase/synthase
MPNRPIVYFIGAGPGDPGLITARGARCLAAADVVVYDRLVHPGLFRYLRPDCERIDVGRAAPQGVEQDAISYLLVEKAREGKEGKTVARLKWGDPFVFDDGGEEALFVHEHGVLFEVVPGVTAGIGVPAYAGIAVTYRGGGDALTFVRGYEDASSTKPRIDWASLANLDGTIVCYAGPRQVPAILSALLTNGRPHDEPAALVYNGTLPTQQTVTGTLGSLSTTARAADLPAMVIVGRVAALREHLRWFDVRPLFGRRIVVTRPREQARELVELLEDQGAQVIQAPLFRIAPPEDYAPLDEAVARAGTFAWIVFTSANGVDSFLRRLTVGPWDLRDLKGPRICAVGAAAAEHLRAAGVKADVALAEYRPELVVETLKAGGDLSGREILLPRADGIRDALAAELRKAGASVIEVAAYRTLPISPDEPGEPDVFKMLLERQVDVMTFTGPMTVRDFVRAHGAEAVADLLKNTAVACLGPVTAQAAEAQGITPTIVAEDYTIPGLVTAIVNHARAGGPLPE